MDKKYFRLKGNVEVALHHCDCDHCMGHKVLMDVDIIIEAESPDNAISTYVENEFERLQADSVIWRGGEAVEVDPPQPVTFFDVDDFLRVDYK